MAMAEYVPPLGHDDQGINDDASFAVRPVSDALGIEIRGFDLRDGLTGDSIISPV